MTRDIKVIRREIRQLLTAFGYCGNCRADELQPGYNRCASCMAANRRNVAAYRLRLRAAAADDTADTGRTG